MGWDYALVHLKYTIPVAVVLTWFYRPLCTRLDIYKIGFLITIAVLSTIPWDSYLIRTKIWSYPSNVVLGPKLFQIPAEEVFFFFIQTYFVSLFYLILSKPTFRPKYLIPGEIPVRWKIYRTIGQALLVAFIAHGAQCIQSNSLGTYMGLILVWAGPFLLLLWTLGYQFILTLPLTSTLIPVAVPTLYLWVVDTFALRRGTWVIESGTKYGFHVWEGLDIEEAVFFLVTNMLIVFGLVAFDNGVAILESACTNLSYGVPLPSPLVLVKALLLPNSAYNEDRLSSLRQAVIRLQNKSRSFYLASAVFDGPLRVNLILLYSFCRLADDLVDQASSEAEASMWIQKLRKYLDLRSSSEAPSDAERCSKVLHDEFPPFAHLALSQLPFEALSREPLYELLRGFEIDLGFAGVNDTTPASKWPIVDEEKLDHYSYCVAGTVAELCLDLVFQDYPEVSRREQTYLKQAAKTMGIALQLVNISRDIAVDADMKRVYIPSTWLQAAGLEPVDILRDARGPGVEMFRSKLLDKAFELYNDARGAIDDLPAEVCGPMRVAVDSYMEIGRTLRQPHFEVKAGRATVPKARRLWVAWRSLHS